MEEKSTTLVFRVAPDLKNAFEHMAKQQDQTTSQLLRAYMRFAVEEWTRKNAQQSLFDKKETQPPTQQKKMQPARKKGAFSTIPPKGRLL